MHIAHAYGHRASTRGWLRCVRCDSGRLLSRGSEAFNPTPRKVNYADAKLRSDRSIALRLLKAENAPLCLGFLHSVFRADRAVVRPQSEMVSRLTTVIEELADDSGERRFPRPAKDYLDAWIAAGALVTRYDDQNEVVYELTPEADQAILMFENLGDRPRNTAGAESKLRAITATLRELAERANPDRDARIRALEEETLVVHRLINDHDREVVERAAGEIDRSAAAFLPTLAPGEAAIVGVDFPIPLTVQVRKPNVAHQPRSSGPDYQSAWDPEALLW
jgi:hypothetical protein